MNFWQKLRKRNKPFFVLAPMANVTDAAFRKMLAKYGKPDVMWTEFVSADGLISAGQKKLLIDLKYDKSERPIVAQLFSANPEAMKKAAALVEKLGFDGLDINMGCPDRSVEKQGGGAAMMKNPKLALEVLEAAREGASNIPVSVKTRLGYNKVDFTWLEMLLAQRPPALTVHLRTRKELSDVPAHWELMPEIVSLRDRVQADYKVSERTLLIGNGDVSSMAEAREKIKESGCDGIMIGRGVFGRPWFFGDTDSRRSGNNVAEKSPKDRLKLMLEHAILFDKYFRGKKNFAVMKKHFKAYVSGWDGAKELRVKLMEANNLKEVKSILKQYASLS